MLLIQDKLKTRIISKIFQREIELIQQLNFIIDNKNSLHQYYLTQINTPLL